MKSLVDYIIEGSWGYEPNDGDGPLDMRFVINLSIFESIYDACKKYIDDAITKDYSSWAWDAIGNIEYFFERATELDNLADRPTHTFDKYDFWWKLKARKQKDIVKLYKIALDKCENDEKWINEWREPELMRESLQKRRVFLDNMTTLQNQKDEYEKEIKQKRKNTY